MKVFLVTQQKQYEKKFGAKPQKVTSLNPKAKSLDEDNLKLIADWIKTPEFTEKLKEGNKKTTEKIKNMHKKLYDKIPNIIFDI